MDNSYCPLIAKTRPTIYPFNLDPSGHGAPRFHDGKLVTQRQWRALNNMEKTPYQVSLGLHLLEENKRLMDAKIQRRSESKEYRRRTNPVFHPWGSGSGNPNYTRPFCKSNEQFLRKLNGEDCHPILKSDLGGGGEPIFKDDGERDTRRKGPFVNIEPSGVKVSEKTHFPAPLDGRRIGRRRRKASDNFAVLSQPDMAAWMSRLETQQTHRTAPEEALKIKKNDVSHPHFFGSYRTVLPIKDYPKVPLKLIHGEPKQKIWKFNENSPLFRSLVEN
ncbi:Oidioi.mRNA.OKI2018_I69.chr2.g4807.t1.cds [Oikopleura dioica]|uniref:Oidioi.mRNA.OKI2018_I69.chr2.g4807.t1.cds n=1 Tax=Oikopleura dioica TaxID=34765 RepID=A0ABN7SYW5_OIKDI|nr:Oidioi.mRNA.OKI2018_I69.chr2.g4807.t1.cds [Oikopleura dioica]